jgi:hypothetical protein
MPSDENLAQRGKNAKAANAPFGEICRRRGRKVRTSGGGEVRSGLMKLRATGELFQPDGESFEMKIEEAANGVP